MVTLTWSDDAGAVFARGDADRAAVRRQPGAHRRPAPSPRGGVVGGLADRLVHVGRSQRLRRGGARCWRAGSAHGRHCRGGPAGSRVRRGRDRRAGLGGGRPRPGHHRDVAARARRCRRGGPGAGDRGRRNRWLRLAASPRSSRLAHRQHGLAPGLLLAEEMPIHEDDRCRPIAAAETDPQLYANLYEVGWPDSPHRALRNSTADGVGGRGPPASSRSGRERAT